MNNLQKLIKLRGLTVIDIAKEIGHGYHSTQKVIKVATFKRRDGSLGTYTSREIQNGIARVLGLSHNQLWGDESQFILQGLIREEIKKKTQLQEQAMHEQWLNPDKINVNKKTTTGNV